jgi:hypothetical protein
MGHVRQWYQAQMGRTFRWTVVELAGTHPAAWYRM